MKHGTKTGKISPTYNSKNSSKEMIDEDGVVDDFHERKIEKKIRSRCSPSYFYNAMAELKPILGKRQKIRISETPFGKWIDIPILACFSGRIDYFLNRFDVPSSSFVVSKDIKIPFRSPEFSFILGLHHTGLPIDLKMKKDSVFLSSHFNGKISKAHRSTIREKMLLLAKSKDKNEIDDFVRLFILFVFSCIIFPTSSYLPPSFVFPYLDDLDTFFDHAWGDAAFQFLYQEICHLESKFYMDGCVVGLMALVYEALPSVGVCSNSNANPRLFRWEESAIPFVNAAEVTKSLLKSIDSTQVLSMQPCYEEEKLLHPNRVLKLEEETSKVRRLEKIVKRQMDEIEFLRKRCAELEARNARSGGNEKELVAAECENVEERVGELKKSPDKATELGHDDVSSCNDVDVVVHDVPDLDEENKVLEGSPNESSCGSDVAASKVVDNVRTVADRVKKRKGSLLVSSSSSMSKCRMEVKEQPFVIDVDQDSSTWTKENMDDLKGRVDFIGRENASDEDTTLVLEFLAKEELEAIIWEDGCIRLSGRELRIFLFREPVESTIINAYMRIMQKQSLMNGSEIYCTDTNVQENVLYHLKEYGKNRTIPTTGYEAFLSRLQSSTREKLMELNEDVFRRCKYVIFPINDRWHWFLLVFDTREGTFKLWNSNHDALSMGTARVYVKFLAGCMSHLSGFELVYDEVVRERCRQQEPTLVNCGVYACMWLFCLAYDTADVWDYEQLVNMEAYRVRVAATLLGAPS